MPTRSSHNQHPIASRGSSLLGSHFSSRLFSSVFEWFVFNFSLFFRYSSSIMLKLFFSQTDLASGGCMGNFRWDGGAKRKFLDESLPTDSAVIIFFSFILI